jgi:hypothetical protein
VSVRRGEGNEQQWRGPNIRDPDRIVVVLRVEEWERCRLGQWVPAKAYLDASPAVRDHAQHGVELVLAERLVCEGLGE